MKKKKKDYKEGSNRNEICGNLCVKLGPIWVRSDCDKETVATENENIDIKREGGREEGGRKWRSR